MRKMTPRQAADAKETRRIRELVRRVAKGKVFESFDVELTEDVSFYLDPDYPTDHASIKVLSDMRRRVTRALYDAGIERIPYVRHSERERWRDRRSSPSSR